MGLLRLVGSIKLQFSFAEYCLFYRAFWQKIPIFQSILLTKVTPYAECCSVVQCVLYACIERHCDVCDPLSLPLPHKCACMIWLYAYIYSVLQCVAVCCSVLRRADVDIGLYDYVIVGILYVIWIKQCIFTYVCMCAYVYTCVLSFTMCLYVCIPVCICLYVRTWLYDITHISPT